MSRKQNLAERVHRPAARLPRRRRLSPRIKGRRALTLGQSEIRADGDSGATRARNRLGLGPC